MLFQISSQVLATALTEDYTSFLQTHDDTKKVVDIHENSDSTSAPQDPKQTPAQTPLKKTFLTDEELQAVIAKLPDKEKEIIAKIQNEISLWPKSVFNEISTYREFVMTARKIAEEKYKKLSLEAKNAIDHEKQLKAQLTPETVRILETIQLRAKTPQN